MAYRFWIAYLTLAQREVTRFSRIWSQTLLPSPITMTLYLVIFGSLVGSRIGTMGGYDYMDFIVPGLIMMAVINNSYGNVVASFFGSKFQHNIEEMFVSPMPMSIILAGYVTGGVLRGVAVACLVTLTASILADIHFAHPFMMASVCILTAILFSVAGLLNGIFARKFDDINIMPTFVLTPLTYLGGVFYSVNLLPEFWQKVTYVNPIFYMVNAFRYSMLGVTDVNIGTAMGMIVLFIIALTTLALWLMEKGYRLKN